MRCRTLHRTAVEWVHEAIDLFCVPDLPPNVYKKALGKSLGNLRAGNIRQARWRPYQVIGKWVDEEFSPHWDDIVKPPSQEGTE